MALFNSHFIYQGEKSMVEKKKFFSISKNHKDLKGILKIYKIGSSTLEANISSSARLLFNTYILIRKGF
jgi:hypothetical protein